ncbi:DUF6477 family protein [Wenxinia marina]|uniref:Uncharacterized protein n=1 Tax=Wenxinia marina DSM 24838 TaxID=1123501 RepID=A0A0D0Q9A0_9RHOB|nr:DUF6477 family protein [Wenxinia marina]KIQ67633.1 hypothetical protein Wenmar_03762 [Wenxinia marina DSM 24838]GGL80107.1 hypothetical protein GCM10011392_38350 [Wenxinia marina]
MEDLQTRVKALRRPRLLVSAARYGLEDYDRLRVLPRVLGGAAPGRPGPALMRLLDREVELDEQRRSGTADYKVAVHVETLIALMGEAALLRDLSRPRAGGPIGGDQMKASGIEALRLAT